MMICDPDRPLRSAPRLSSLAPRRCQSSCPNFLPHPHSFETPYFAGSRKALKTKSTARKIHAGPDAVSIPSKPNHEALTGLHQRHSHEQLKRADATCLDGQRIRFLRCSVSTLYSYNISVELFTGVEQDVTSSQTAQRKPGEDGSGC